MQPSSGTLPYGVYFGEDEQRVDLPGFSVSLLRPRFRVEDVNLHTHSQASFVLVLAGSYRSSADGAAPVSHAPQLIFNPAGTTHRDSFLVPSGRFLAISLSDRMLETVKGEFELPKAAVAYSAGESLRAAELARACCGNLQDHSDIMEDTVWSLVCHATARGGRVQQNRKLAPSWAAKARDLMHDRSIGPLCIPDAAREIGVHPVYFARAFRRVFGCTPAEYRTRCRLQRAMSLLRKTNRPLAVIALECGFYDQSHFSTLFANHFGRPPNAYRTQLRKHKAESEVDSLQDAAYPA